MSDVGELDAIMVRCGKRELIVSHHRTEFTSNVVLAWTQPAKLS